MYDQAARLEPLYLSEEEVMALLDLCLTSPTETDSIKERVMLKLSDFARRHLSESRTESHTREPDNGSCKTVEASAPAASAVDSPKAFDDTVVARVLALSSMPMRRSHRSPHRLVDSAEPLLVSDALRPTRSLLERLLHRSSNSD